MAPSDKVDPYLALNGKPESAPAATKAPEPIAAQAAPAHQFKEGAIYRDPETGVKKRFVCGLFTDA